MTPPRVRASLAVAAAAALIFGLTSCAPAANPSQAGGGNVGSGAPTATPTPTPTPSPVSTLDLTPPAPLVALDCNKFAKQSQVNSAFGNSHSVAIPTAAIATGDLEANDSEIPTMDYVREAGGIACLWSDKPSNFYAGGIGAAFPHEHAEQVAVLFNAQTAWTNEENVDGEPGPMSGGSCDIGSCQLDQLFSGTTWMDATELNQKSAITDPFGKILDQTKAAILAGGPAGPLPAPDAGTLALPSNCTAFVADSAVSSALGGIAVTDTQPLLRHDDFDTYGIWSGAQDELKDHPCAWKHGSASVGHLSWLPGGAWAWNEAKVLPLRDGPSAPLAVPGLASGDTAFIRCASGDASCVADLVLGGNWISVQVKESGAINRSAVTAIAAAIVAQLG